MGDIAFKICKEVVPRTERGKCDAIQMEVEEIIEKQENSTTHLIVAMEMKPEDVYPVLLTKYKYFCERMMRDAIMYMRQKGLKPFVKKHTEQLFGFIKMRMQGLLTDVIMQIKIPTYKGGKFGFAMGYSPEYEKGDLPGTPGGPGGPPDPNMPNDFMKPDPLAGLDPKVRANIERSLNQRSPSHPNAGLGPVPPEIPNDGDRDEL